MNRKIKDFFTNFRIILLLVSLLIGLIVIHPNPFVNGVIIKTVELNGSANQAGIINPGQEESPMARERIVSLNYQQIGNIADYYTVLSTLKPNLQYPLKTNKGTYYVIPKFINGSPDLQITVADAPTTNIRKGIDLAGGTRVVLKPEGNLSETDKDLLKDGLERRLNSFGLSDVSVRIATDLLNNVYYIVEIPGINDQEIRELLEKEGKFEARISNQTVFMGGDDIVYVQRAGYTRAPVTCGRQGDGYACNFEFGLTLSHEAADQFKNLTQNLLNISDPDSGKQYLNESIYFYLDGVFEDSLRISADLAGKSVQEVIITGGEFGSTEKEAHDSTSKEMKQLQTLLVTGSLPVKVIPVSSELISPSLGDEFSKNALFVGFISLMAVAIIIFIRYRDPKIIASILFITWSEIFLLISVAATGIFGWKLDIASIAGIIIVIGTGLNDQLIITDETLRGEKEAYSWKRRMKMAFFIVFAAYFTTMVSMLPLLKAGAGLLKGFALSTMIGVTIGVLITRPAYAKILEIIIKNRSIR